MTGTVADVISFNAAISACGKGGQWEQAVAMLHKMRTVGMIVNVISFFQFLHGHLLSMRERSATGKGIGATSQNTRLAYLPIGMQTGRE